MDTKYRITPAGAGKTHIDSMRTATLQDHPRRCGENLPCKREGNELIRITPAGAGKTLWQWSIVHDTRDHPRRCGENAVHRTTAVPDTGSPPQVRGKP